MRIEDLEASAETQHKDAMLHARIWLERAAHFAHSANTHAPTELFRLPLDPEDAARMQWLDADRIFWANFLWRVCIVHLGPWVLQGIPPALEDRKFPLDMVTRSRIARVMRLCRGKKLNATKARDVALVTGLKELNRMNVAITSSETRVDYGKTAERFAYDILNGFDAANIAENTIATIWRRRHKTLAKVTEGMNGLSIKEAEAHWRAIL
ncbi:hypothetical protein [Thalassococcus lentus]|uniref:Uncharacterized protein n=1 Tax=Thalassococcus lentus TaxID=1210524 RepID=A0ABT4XUP7_9RHOB|nr:hypothetical protein [Thalassococcus lentus]MDA7425570.1 hypothetical protein [Thalassococcus lentus]